MQSMTFMIMRKMSTKRGQMQIDLLLRWFLSFFVKFKFMTSSSIRALESRTPNMLQWHAAKLDEFCFNPSYEVLDREDLVLEFFQLQQWVRLLRVYYRSAQRRKKEKGQALRRLKASISSTTVKRLVERKCSFSFSRSSKTRAIQKSQSNNKGDSWRPCNRGCVISAVYDICVVLCMRLYE